MTTTHFRATSWTAAGVGILISFALHTCRQLATFNPFELDSFRIDILPYEIVALASFMTRTRGLAFVSLIVSLFIAAVGTYAFIDLIRGPAINDIQLITDPLRWLFALIALAVAGLDILIRRSSNA